MITLRMASGIFSGFAVKVHVTDEDDLTSLSSELVKRLKAVLQQLGLSEQLRLLQEMRLYVEIKEWGEIEEGGEYLVKEVLL